MKILLDECLPVDFRHSFQAHEAHTAEWAGTNQIEDLLPLAPAILEALKTVRPGETVSVP